MDLLVRTGSKQSPDLVGITLRPESVPRSSDIYMKPFLVVYIF